MQSRKQRYKEPPPIATERTNTRTETDVEQSDLGSERSHRGRPSRNDQTQTPIQRSTEETEANMTANTQSPPSTQSPQRSYHDQSPASHGISESSKSESSQLDAHSSPRSKNEVLDDDENLAPQTGVEENRENSYALEASFGRGIDSIDILLEENDPFEYQADNEDASSISRTKKSAQISPISKMEQLSKVYQTEASQDTSQPPHGNEMDMSARSSYDTPFYETYNPTGAHIFQSNFSTMQSERQEKTRIIPFFPDSSSLWSFETNNRREKDTSFQTIDSVDTISEKGTPNRMSTDGVSGIHGGANHPQGMSTPVNLMSEHSYLQKRKWFHQQYGLDRTDASTDDSSVRDTSESESLHTTPLPRGPIYRNEGNCKYILLPWRSNYIETQFAKKVIPSTASLGPINKPFIRIPNMAQHPRSYDSSIEIVGVIPNHSASDTDTIEGSTVTSVQQKSTKIQPQRKFIMPQSMRVSIMASYSAKDRRQKGSRSSTMKSNTDEQYQTYAGAKSADKTENHADESTAKELAYTKGKKKRLRVDDLIIKESYSIITNRSQEMHEDSNISSVINRENSKTPGDVDRVKNAVTEKTKQNEKPQKSYVSIGVSATPTPEANSANKIAIDYRDMRASLIYGQIRKHATESTGVAAYFDSSKMDDKRGNVPKSMSSWKRCARHVAIAYFIENHRSGFMKPLTYQPKISNPPFGLPSFPFILSSQHNTMHLPPLTNAQEPIKNSIPSTILNLLNDP